ncbi:hypothetical protein IFR04_015925 [Cadophora malorum]|uniref:CHAT domain-containing protein n=1 Tax=Cadophora malorum TaxID=108018 RepID=A0A8H7W4T9_9HELO|nr:hypothetical protein IFR04_015925 [Cadophora malorum]
MDSNLSAVKVAELALREYPSGQPDRAWALYELAKAYQARYSADHSSEDLESARKLYIEAIDSECDLTKKARYLNNLGIVYQYRYDQTGDDVDLDAFLDNTREATIHISNEIRSAVLKNYANALQARYNHRGDKADLDSCIETYQEALSLQPVYRPSLCCNLCAALITRYGMSNINSDLDEALDFGHEAVYSTDDDHPQKALFLDNYASALYASYATRNAPADLEDSINCGRATVELAQTQGLPGLAGMRINLGGSLASRFKLYRNTSDLDEASELFSLAGDMLSPQHPSFEKCLTCKANVLRMKFEETASEVDLTLAVESGSRAVSLSMGERNIRAQSEDSLGKALLRRYDLVGSSDVLDRAVELFKQALGHATNPSLVADIWHNLGTALQARFELRGALGDLDAAQGAIEESIETSLNDRPEYASSLAALGNVLIRKFERLDDPGMLNQAITSYEEALEKTSETDWTRAGRLTCLGHALQIRYELTGSETDFENAVGFCQESVDISHNGPHCSLCLVNLGNCFLRHVVKGPSDSDHDLLSKAIRNLELAAEQMPRDFATRAMCLNNLGKAYELRYEMKEQYYDFNQARKYYEAAMRLNSAPPMLRVTAGYRGMILTWSENPSMGLMFLRETTAILPLISPRLLNRVDQQDNIATFSGLGSLGASIILESGGHVEEAIQTLEMSRGVMNSLLLETRLETGDLERVDPSLATEFKALRDQLDGSSSSLTRASELPKGAVLDMESRIKAAKRLDEILKQIHSDETTKRAFLASWKEDVRFLSETEALVTINVSSIRSDALIATRNKTWHFQLKDLHQRDVLKQAQDFIATLENDNPVSRKKTNKSLRELLSWLWNSIVGPILSELGVGGRTDKWPHIWWIPVGLLSIFPLHAAGDHSGKTNENALDQVISSYATTIRSLSYSRKINQRPINLASVEAVFVVMSSTPNQNDLLFADAEVSELLGKSSNDAVKRVVFKSPTSKQDVLPALQLCNVAHFSCHGIVDFSNPSASTLLLSDWETDPLTVANITALKVSNARLAYLSACHASSNRELDLLDEGIHLTGAFQMAGFAQAIGTLWQVDDERSGLISQTVWDTMLTETGALDFSKAAEGLHHAVRKLREQTRWIEGMPKRFPDQPMVWAPFVHMGV